MHPDLSTAEIERVTETVADYCSKQ